MLKQVEKVISMKTEGELPRVPAALKEYLQGCFTAEYLEYIGVIDMLKAKGNSEGYILGYISGINHASCIIDEIEYLRENPQV